MNAKNVIRGTGVPGGIYCRFFWNEVGVTKNEGGGGVGI